VTEMTHDCDSCRWDMKRWPYCCLPGLPFLQLQFGLIGPEGCRRWAPKPRPKCYGNVTPTRYGVYR